MIHYKIYTLKCNIENSIKYVGLTRCNTLKTRLDNHWSGDEGTLNKNLWIAKCRLSKVKPTIELLDSIITDNKSEAYDLEMYWINQFKQWGFNLVNGSHYMPNKRKYISPEQYKELRDKEYNEYYNCLTNLKP